MHGSIHPVHLQPTWKKQPSAASPLGCPLASPKVRYLTLMWTMCSWRKYGELSMDTQSFQQTGTRMGNQRAVVLTGFLPTSMGN